MAHTPITGRTYTASGRYGYYCVDEEHTHANEKDTGSYGSLCVNTRKLARQIASALTSAYRDGRADERTANDAASVAIDSSEASFTDTPDDSDRVTKHASVDALEWAMRLGELRAAGDDPEIAY